MRFRRLFITNLATTFSKGSQKPVQSLVIKMSLAVAVAVMLSRVIAKIIDHTQLPVDVPLRITAVIIMSLAFILCGLLLLVSQPGQEAYQGSFARITRLMPLPKPVRYLLQLAPSLTAVLLVILLGSTALGSVAKGIGQPFVVLELCWVAGALSGLGLQFMVWLRSKLYKVAYFVASTTLAVVGLEKIYNTSSSFVVCTVPYLLMFVVLFPLVGLIHQYLFGYISKLAVVDQNHRQQLPELLPFKAWLGLKLWRNVTVRNSLLATVLLSGLMAATIILRRQLIADTYPILLFCALLASTFSTEIRGVLRRYMPPESVLITGMRGLITQQLGVVYLLGIIIGLPLFFSVNGQAADSNRFAITFLCMQAYAVAAGQFVGAVLMPGGSETGTQFFASLLAGALVAFYPKYTHIADMSFSMSSVTWLAGAMMWAVLVYITEAIRRKSYGRAR